ncbi:unnamed protein product, partial [Mesorhabditis belari]|uniref:Peptidase M14 domain-containing protein n=1 Tax=Mesorhabditis belari TaxID=2138241 RepID=A0AAF3EVL3_9BILA
MLPIGFFLFGLVSAGVVPLFPLTRYHDFPDFEQYLIDVANSNPSFVQLRDIGRTHEGRRLLGLKIGKPGVNKPVVWIDGGNHAREWPAFHTAIYFIEQFVTRYGQSDRITDYIDKLDIYVFPVLNPDGFVFSRTDTKDLIRQWRKNRAPKNCSGFHSLTVRNVCCEGVDLNRNWDFAFKQTNYPFNNPCSDEFQGPFPFSEPETRAVRDYVTSRELSGRIHAFFSMHTHGQLWILPYNDHRKHHPKDYADLERLAFRAAEALYQYRETKYKIGTAADMLGPATGGATDWIKANTNTKYVYVLELPPDLSSWFAFQVRPHWLLPIAKETWLAVKVILEQTLEDHNLARA